MTLLNDTQMLAVKAGDGPALVLAGAGSGKTRVIVERLAWLVSERGIDPRNLLALTFTNKAAGEMRSRTAQRLEVEELRAWIGTFHSFGLYLLRREISALGRDRTFTGADDADQLSLMKALMKELPKGMAPVSPREALSWISRNKQDLSSPELEEDGQEVLRWLWNKYHARLEQASALDFDDLLVLTARLLEEHPEVREKYQRRFRHVLIDEYQDTNRAQYLIALRLSEGHGNIFAVGDEDQGIYSWRGASIRNILDFEKDFPNTRVFRLEQNYRSTAPILRVANEVVSHNVNRLGKTLWTAAKEGGQVRFYLADDGEAEARFVAEDLVSRGLSPKQVAILFRTNGQSRPLEEALRVKGLAYCMVGGTQFYGRKEIKDVLAYLRVLVNPKDDLSLRRILNVPARGIGATTLEQLDAYTRDRGMPLLQVLREVETDQSISGRARTAIGEFVQLMDDLSLKAKTTAGRPLVEEVGHRSGYRECVAQAD
ncbi:MAG: UvrD-helicase domain-containing protein, partial [Candidatus Hydrogenedentes bacterium]|nr:UvrD-helicase domain-containing protein [Candidatus Hydrogenedentota bacterium]